MIRRKYLLKRRSATTRCWREILKTAHPKTRLCIAADLTSANEFIQTKTIAEWQKKVPELHKRPAIFLIFHR